MILYSYRFSPKCRSILAVAHHTGIDLELRETDLPSGDQRHPSFLAINPNGKVPVLIDHTLVLSEANAILQYLANRATSPLWPADAAPQAEVLKWLSWQLTELAPVVDPVVYFGLITTMHSGSGTGTGKMPRPDPGKLEADLNIAAEILDRHLSGRDFLVADGLTIADFAVLACLTNIEFASATLAQFPNLTRWRNARSEEEAWRATIPPLEIGVEFGG